MRRDLLATAVMLTSLLAPGSMARAGDEGPLVGPRVFVGLWEGIDPSDGSTQHVSITCAEGFRDGQRSATSGSSATHRQGRDQAVTICDVRLTDTFFTDCAGAMGFAQGDGAIEDGFLVVAEFRLACQNGDTLTDSELFIPDFANGTLINDDGRPPSTVFHRISN